MWAERQESWERSVVCTLPLLVSLYNFCSKGVIHFMDLKPKRAQSLLAVEYKNTFAGIFWVSLPFNESSLIYLFLMTVLSIRKKLMGIRPKMSSPEVAFSLSHSKALFLMKPKNLEIRAFTWGTRRYTPASYSFYIISCTWQDQFWFVVISKHCGMSDIDKKCNNKK